MATLTEIRWHGRGGQGAKTAALLLAEAASEAGLHVQGFPEYGPERMGAPVLAYNRLSDEPIFLHCHISRPSVIAVLDPTLIKDPGVAAGLADGGVVVVNSTAEPETMRGRLRLDGRPEVRVATVDASGISMDCIGQAIPNTAMMGAVIRVTGLLEFDRFMEVARRLLGEKFRARPALVDGNLEAIRRAYGEVAVG
ncbi:MAG: 2-oxoacid:acceptor oxidoreductase family protein [Bacillota bacterium]